MDRRQLMQAGLATLAGHWLAGCAGRPAVAPAAPDWTLETTDGDFVRLKDLRGSVVLMCFLASNNPMNQVL